MKIAIAGYGNLGKSVEKLAKNDPNLELTAVISRRNLDNELFVPMENAAKVDADVVVMCLGSYADLEKNLFRFADFDTIDSFDDHKNTAAYVELCNEIKPNKLSIVGAGWDPGLLSLARGALSCCGADVCTLWGKGQSLGHSNAIRSLDGVIDAVQFTCPKPDAEKLIAKGERRAEKLHDRVCYVACVGAYREQIEQKIRQMPRYFDGYDVTVNFCSPKRVRELKSDAAHRGAVIASGENYCAKLDLHVRSNSDFTAQILLALAKKIPELKKRGYVGAKTLFDLPLGALVDRNLY